MAKKTGKRRPTVRGPQVSLKLGKAKGETRAVRVRYVEPPLKKQGSPFFAVRVPAELLVAFGKLCEKRGESMQASVRAFMSKATGVDLAAEGDE